MPSGRKIVNVITLVFCLGFVFLGLYLYFFKGVPIQPVLILGILFFGAGAVISIISLISNRESWAIDIKKLTKPQSIAMGICGLIFSVCCIWIAFVVHSFFLKLILIFGFIMFSKWSINLLMKQF